MVAFRLPVLSSLRGPQPATLHVLPTCTFEFGDIQSKGYIGKGSHGLEYKANHKTGN